MKTPIIRSIVCPTLIGRTSHLDMLAHCMAQVHEGHGQTILVSGEAGIGKSRLIAEAIAYARSGLSQTPVPDIAVLEGRCFELDRSFPYAPVLDLLHFFLATHSLSDLALLMGSRAYDLIQLLPDIADFLPEPVQRVPLDSQQEKRRLFSALLYFFTQLAQKQPLIVTIEDIHWSDESSLEFLLYLARQIVSQPVLLLLAYRSEEEHPALLQFFAGLDRERLTTELTLSHLTIDEAEVMVRSIFKLPHMVSANFMNAVYRFTEGNPFFIEEMLKSLVTAGEITYNDGKWEHSLQIGETLQGIYGVAESI